MIRLRPPCEQLQLYMDLCPAAALGFFARSVQYPEEMALQLCRDHPEGPLYRCIYAVFRHMGRQLYVRLTPCAETGCVCGMGICLHSVVVVLVQSFAHVECGGIWVFIYTV